MQSPHGGVGAQDDHRPVGSNTTHGPQHPRTQVGVHRVDVDLVVVQAQGHVGRPGARGQQPRPAGADTGQRRGEVHVPQPGDVAAVGVVIVDGDDDGVRVVGTHRAQGLAESGRILDQVQHEATALDRERLTPPERGLDRSQAGGHGGRRERERQRQRRRTRGVLSVVRAAGPQRDLVGLGADLQTQPAGLAEVHGQENRRRLRRTASFPGGLVDAVELLVGRKVGAQLRGDPEVRHGHGDRGRQGNQARVVAIEDDGRPRRRRHRGQQVGRLVDLAETVELVAHHVEQEHPLRAHQLDEAHRVGLVQLEHGDFGVDAPAPVGLVAHRRDGSADEVATCVVREHAVPLAQDGGDHLRRGRLAVGTADQDHALRQTGQRRGQEAGEHPLDDQTW